MTSLNISSQNVIPEWEEPKGLVLVYPKDIRSGLTLCYQELIKSVLNTTELTELTLIVRPSAKQEIENFCESLNTKISIRYFESEKIKDIWARDFCPIFFSDRTVCKALYNPSYFKAKEIGIYADPDDQVGIELADFLELRLNYFRQTGKNNLIFDGGNFIHNGQGTAIMTNRVITDNETLSIEQLKDVFKTKLNISELIIAPVEPGDETGHIDGMVRFVDEETVLVASYPNEYEKGEKKISKNDFEAGKQFLNILADSLSKRFKIVRIENSIPKDELKFPSAFGNYINFLRIGNVIFLPHYGIPEDRLAKDILESNFPNLTVLTIEKDIAKLSKYGGVLNCISWTYY